MKIRNYWGIHGNVFFVGKYLFKLNNKDIRKLPWAIHPLGYYAENMNHVGKTCAKTSRKAT